MTLGSNKRNRAVGVLGVLVLALGLILTAGVACKKKAEAPSPAATEPSTVIKEGLNDFEGTVKIASNKYLYIPEIQGMDVLVPGMANLASLAGKEVKVQGEFHRDRPSLLVATKIEAKEDGSYSTVFTRTAQPDFGDYVDLKDRASYPTLKIVNVNKTDAWEGQAKGRVFGKLQKQPESVGGATKDIYRIVINDDNGKLVGYVVADQFSDYATYYLSKLRLFDSFWFYLNIKDTVEAKTRVKTKDLFHADIVCAGLF
jgi:hypothetical protein